MPLLPRVVRWARLPAGDEAARERRRADFTATERVLDALPGMAAERDAGPEVADQLSHRSRQLQRVSRSGSKIVECGM